MRAPHKSGGRAGRPDVTHCDHWWLQRGKTILAHHPLELRIVRVIFVPRQCFILRIKKKTQIMRVVFAQGPFKPVTTFLELCASSSCRNHGNLLCIPSVEEKLDYTAPDTSGSVTGSRQNTMRVHLSLPSIFLHGSALAVPHVRCQLYWGALHHVALPVSFHRRNVLWRQLRLPPSCARNATHMCTNGGPSCS